MAIPELLGSAETENKGLFRPWLCSYVASDNHVAKGLLITSLTIKLSCYELFYHHLLSLNLAFNSQLFSISLINAMQSRIYFYFHSPSFGSLPH